MTALLAGMAFCPGMIEDAAAVLITRNVNQFVPATPDSPDNIYNLDVNLDGVDDFTFTSIIGIPEDPGFASFTTLDFPFGTNNAAVVDANTLDGFPTVSRLAPGDTVGPANPYSFINDQGNLFFVTIFDPPSGNFQNQSGYIGFRFMSGADLLYGFAQITVNDLFAPTDPLGLTIGRVGYETLANTGVTIPADEPVVPEPATLSLFGLGMLSLARLRARRKLRVAI